MLVAGRTEGWASVSEGRVNGAVLKLKEANTKENEQIAVLSSSR
jgi:hypothetical protein